jgi:hypothetical protein
MDISGEERRRDGTRAEYSLEPYLAARTRDIHDTWAEVRRDSFWRRR